ncbi:Nitrilase family, member 2 [Seminavis robusta]|uniref:Nitrilase family, member 2 n=1 Tax=Seminavis robusta TaxID=568900 RepID=A0A9N8HDC0_9STRA|nr:Nitrilase family, member 2 [Seminavis robusta]|eukprot:Sro354_g124720.1 Nitrilase family, member 2 (368) ;mRNA; f:19877-20980
MLMSNPSSFTNANSASYPETMNLDNDPMMSKLQQFAVPLPDHLRLNSTAATSSGKGVFSDNFVPSEFHVICGRGKKVFEHCGNVRFRNIIMGHLDSYKAAPSKAQKSAVVSTIFDKLTQGEGAFVKQDTNTEGWFVVSESAAREKISQCFRDCLQDKFKLLGGASTTTVSDAKTAAKPTKHKTKRTVAKKLQVLEPPKRAMSAYPVFKKSKLGRARTFPLTMLHTAPTAPAAASNGGSTNDAFSQLLSFSKSVMPGRRRRAIPASSLTLPDPNTAGVSLNFPTSSSNMGVPLNFPVFPAMQQEVPPPPPAMPTNPFLMDDMEPLPILHDNAAARTATFEHAQHPDFEPLAFFPDIEVEDLDRNTEAV